MLAPTEVVKCVFLIGMRGAGKSSLGAAVASSFPDWKWLDMDDLIEKEILLLTCGKISTIKQYVTAEGWEAFRKLESECLVRLVQNPLPNTVISCGGGVVERKENRQCFLMSKQIVVVNIYRPIEEIVEYLKKEEARPAFDADILEVWDRRKPLYKQCSHFDFIMVKGVTYEHICQEFLLFLQNTLLTSKQEKKKKIVRNNSFFLSLTYPDVAEALDDLEELLEGVNVLELRVDLLKSTDEDFIRSHVATIRRHTSLPLIYTVRTTNEGGAFQGSKKEYLGLLGTGFRLGCDFIDIEQYYTVYYSLLQERFATYITNEFGSMIISSVHSLQRHHAPNEIKELFDVVSGHGENVDVLKVVIRAFEVEDAYLIHALASQANTSSIPMIALCTSEKGQLSRVLNQVLTPVTHSLLPFKAAPGQLSVKEIMKIRHEIGMVPACNYFLFGSPIQQSPSPVIHNSGFQCVGLPHIYDLLETEDSTVLINVLRTMSNFGGASVTIPHKQSLLDEMSELSPAAKAIGAINTIIPIAKSVDSATEYNLREGDKHDQNRNLFLGENTDWLGIYRPVKKRLTKNVSKCSALLIGAGGTTLAACYAMMQLKVEQVYIYNRTFEKAEEIAKRFTSLCSSTKFVSISTLDDVNQENVNIIISTIPAAAQFVLPEHFFETDNLGKSCLVVLDVVYKPAVTSLLLQIKNRCPTAQLIQGYEMLVEQAVEQFQFWTGLKAPRGVMLKNCLTKIPKEERLYDIK